MLVDANILLYAVDSSSRLHRPARAWLTSQLNGDRRVGLPWLSLGAFLRISTNPRAMASPLTPAEAWGEVEGWLARDVVWQPGPGPQHANILARLYAAHMPRANLVTDAQLAAIAIEHGLTVNSTDTDFARFTEIRWANPLAPAT